jgi:hypothetical protein
MSRFFRETSGNFPLEKYYGNLTVECPERDTSAATVMRNFVTAAKDADVQHTADPLVGVRHSCSKPQCYKPENKK